MILAIIPIIMFIYMTGMNKGVSHTTENYIDSINNVFDEYIMDDMDILDMNDFKDLDLSDFDLDDFKLNNGFDLKKIYKDNIVFYNIDTMNIENINFDELDILYVDIYLSNLDSIVYDSFHMIIVGNEYTKILNLYNQIPTDEFIPTGGILYKVIKPKTVDEKDEQINTIYNFRIRDENIRMLKLK